MYTKIGLGLLAAAGLTFGVVGMQIGGASPTTPVCTNDGGGSAASAGGNASTSADQNGATNETDGSAGAEGNGAGLNNGSGNGNGNGNGNGSGAVTPPPNPGSNTPSPSAAAADTTFLDLRGHTGRTDVGNGTATVPPTSSNLTGHSRFLHRLLRIDGNVDTDH
jgi:hypothetical protein